MSQFIHLISTVFWIYRNVLHLNVLLTGSGNGLVPMWQQDIPSRWTLVFFICFHLSSPGYSGLMCIDSMVSYHLNTPHYQKAKKTQGPATLKPPQIKMRAVRADTETTTRHITWHSAWCPQNVCVHTHTHTHTHTHIYMPTYTTAHSTYTHPQ